MNRLFTTFIVGAMVLGVAVGWAVNQYATPDQGKIVAENGQKFTRVLIVGIGGSALGPQLVAAAIRKA